MAFDSSTDGALSTFAWTELHFFEQLGEDEQAPSRLTQMLRGGKVAPNLHQPATLHGRAGPGFTAYSMACQSESAAASLLQLAGGQWSTATHKLFPTPAREKAEDLLRVGYRLGAKLSEERSHAFLEVWIAYVIPRLVQRHMTIERGSLVTFHDLTSKPKLNYVSVGKVCGEIIGAGSDNERWPVLVLGSWCLVGERSAPKLYWVPAHPNGAIVTCDEDGLLPTCRPGPFKFRPVNMALLNECPVARHRALEPNLVVAAPTQPHLNLWSELEEVCAGRQICDAWDFEHVLEPSDFYDFGPDRYKRMDIFQIVRRACSLWL